MITVDYTEFDDEGSLDLYGHAVRNALGASKPSALDTATYVARVLSPPFPLDPEHAAAFSDFTVQAAVPYSFGPHTAPTPADQTDPVRVSRKPIQNLSKFTFYGRIEKIHGPLLPDPCDVVYAKDPTMAYTMIAQHTQFISQEGTTIFPSVGDLVNVRLRPGTAGIWDVQYGEYLGINTQISAPIPDFLPPSPRGAFETVPDLEINTIGEVATPETYTEWENPPFEGTWPITSLMAIAPGPKRCIQGNCRHHQGMDFGMPRGTKLVAIGDGIVYDNKSSSAPAAGCPQRVLASGDADRLIYDAVSGVKTDAAKCGGGGGNRITIEHAPGTITMANGQENDHTVWTVYMHLDAPPTLSKGASVMKGQTIGLAGNTGGSAGFHLHFETHVGAAWKTKVDPLLYLKAVPGPEALASAAAADGTADAPQADDSDPRSLQGSAAGRIAAFDV